MPIYAYKCESCGHAKDVLQKLSDSPLTECPACGAASFRKQLTAAGFQLKGSGWYATDFRNGGAKPPAQGEGEGKGPDAKPADGKSGEVASGESKPAEGKSAETKPSETKPSESKAAESKPAPGKPAGKAAGATGGAPGGGD